MHALIGVPLTQFENSTLSLGDLNQRALLQLEESLACARSVSEMKRLLNRFFLEALRGLSPTHAAIHHLLHDLHRSHGALSIMDWSRTHDVDARNLERRFSAAIGMTPKRYARVIRFKHSYHQLISGRLRTAAAGPHLDGFYDQSHFNREFKFFTGVAPSTKLSGQMSSGMSISDHLLEGELG
jgi:transcriptional regulator GlxA family with amidase domain